MEAAVAYPNYCLGICLQWLSKTMKSLSQDSRHLAFEPSTPEYKSTALRLNQLAQ
jgi:hypothetical protein